MNERQAQNGRSHHEQKFHESFIQLVDVAISLYQRNPEAIGLSSQTIVDFYESAQSANKRLSQMVALSWLSENSKQYKQEAKQGQKIRDQIIAPASNIAEKSQQLHNLLLDEDLWGKGNTITVVKELENVLGVNITIKLNPDSFVGYVTENIEGLIYSLPYPPKPQTFNLTDADLYQWCKDTNEEQQFPESLYIPLTWC